MNISREEINKLAHLSRLELDDKAVDKMQEDLNKILGFVAQIEKMELDGVEPLVYMTEETNILREDTVVQEITHAEALKNAPDADTDYFRVSTVKK
ncbi:Asp-tRNA(Asn)/Glu-tRNA(Gln) amidotransferase subunit GatC [Phaeocystidibacter marisrubri]|uniref:Aspartyl/glutamyl-tRNA(Asn/Gln) amidotransferase subunit C n=1 Tax=Phaeocystidibacter marisrubri TaxID=1577780 RepID=A0A6L3ZFT2_9FLAO|nr:Asp-tRNA(Asn)/Glu-tRNA(Gln) amidotransferase subunit GatC [Phaeocystidibacter marisrubri]KAB2816348.1 Asp-tRNA(Asn)/Glu-tRNA(Gln) amidotransferase subunit GatC [Phaeocystidibacter marisrubri]GGH68577.1 aspartyl/glutamyl-tRNA(Asn/Gln) amidotransferase subunit C [Phaeocystidibacter marisrubri]